MFTCFICVSKFFAIKKNQIKNNTRYIFSAYCIFSNVNVKKTKIQITAKIIGYNVACTTGLYELKCIPWALI